MNVASWSGRLRGETRVDYHRRATEFQQVMERYYEDSTIITIITIDVVVITAVLALL